MNLMGCKTFIDAVEPIIGGLGLVPELLEQISKVSKTEISLANIPCKVFNAGVFWDTLKTFEKYNGLQLQVNKCTHHARILDSDDIRIAWGSLRGMEKILDAIIRVSNKYSKI